MKQNRWKYRSITLIALLGTFSMLWAQQNDKNVIKEPQRGQTYLSDQVTYGGNISVAKFQELISQPLWVKDNDGSFYPVQMFTYTYAERGLYEDETGREFISTDLISSRCRDRLDTGMAKSMYYRAKPGDTAYIDQVTFMAPVKGGKQSPAHAKGIKLVLTK